MARETVGEVGVVGVKVIGGQAGQAGQVELRVEVSIILSYADVSLTAMGQGAGLCNQEIPITCNGGVLVAPPEFWSYVLCMCSMYVH